MGGFEGGGGGPLTLPSPRGERGCSLDVDTQILSRLREREGPAPKAWEGEGYTAVIAGCQGWLAARPAS